MDLACTQPVGLSGLQGGLRVTEQGEMVHSKFGSPDIAQVTMESFTTAVVEARLRPPSSPHHESWRDIMEELSSISCEAYRCAAPPSPSVICLLSVHYTFSDQVMVKAPNRGGARI